MIGNEGVFGNDRTCANVDVVADVGSAGDAHTGHEGAEIADGGVVAQGAAG